MRVRLVRYNNKSRQGLYVGIKEEGQRERLFKYNPARAIDDYVEAVEQKQTWHDIRKKPKREHISQSFNKGVTHSITMLEDLSRTDVQEAVYRKLLSPLVKKKELVDILLKNTNKLSKLLAHEVTGLGKNKNKNMVTLFTIHDIGRYNLQELYARYHTKIKKNDLMNSSYLRDLAKGLGLRQDSIKPGDWETGSIIKVIEVKTRFQT